MDNDNEVLIIPFIIMVLKCDNCGKDSKMQCPTCIKLGLPPSHFCSQECFKANWSKHKLYHQIANLTSAETAKTDETSSPNRDEKAFKNYKYSGKLRAFPVTPQVSVPLHIQQPDYYISGEPESEKKSNQSKIPVYNAEEIAGMREVCRLAREVLDIAGAALKVGITGDEIDKIVHAACLERNAYPSPLNYRNFPKSVCVSPNEVICHGIPDMRPIEEGDIINLDVTLYYKGFHGDLNETYFIGKMDERSHNLVKTAYECLSEAMKMVKPGCMYQELGNTIHNVAHKNGCSVDRTYCGHGIGQLFHTAPNVPHYRNNKARGVMAAGHIFTIEPMINAGAHEDTHWPDSWTAVTRDGERSAQFEHTFLVTDDGCEILTRRKDSPLDHMIWDETAIQR